MDQLAAARCPRRSDGPGYPRSGGDRADGATAGVLHERYLQDVLRYVLRRVPQREEAEDIIAQVFAAAFASLPRFRGQCALYLWLLGIARHCRRGGPDLGSA